MRKSFVAGALLTVVVAAPSARAQSAQATAAEALFQEGVQAMHATDYARACERFAQSDKVDAANGTKLALAECEEHRGKTATAWGLYTATVGKLAAGDKRVALVNERIAALEPKLPKLVVAMHPDAPKGTKVREGELVLDAAVFGVALPVDPGEHVYVVSAEGYEDATVKVVANPGETASVRALPGAQKRLAAMIPVAPAPAPRRAEPPKPAPAHRPAEAPPSDARTTAWIVTGAGAASAAVGVASLFVAMGKKSTADANCNDATSVCNAEGKSADDALKTLNLVTVAGLGLGAVGLGVGTWMLLRPSSESRASVYTSPAAVAGGGGWTLGGSF